MDWLPSYPTNKHAYYSAQVFWPDAFGDNLEGFAPVPVAGECAEPLCVERVAAGTQYCERHAWRVVTQLERMEREREIAQRIHDAQEHTTIGRAVMRPKREIDPRYAYIVEHMKCVGSYWRCRECGHRLHNYYGEDAHIQTLTFLKRENYLITRGILDHTIHFEGAQLTRDLDELELRARGKRMFESTRIGEHMRVCTHDKKAKREAQTISQADIHRALGR